MASEQAEILEIKRTCKKCGEEKSLSNFWKDTRSLSGYVSKCKVCVNIQRLSHPSRDSNHRKIRREIYKAKEKTIVNEQVCCRCNQLKPISSFYKNIINPHGYQYACKECVAGKHKNKYRTDADFRRKVIKRATDRNRISKYGVSPEDFKARLLSQNGGCAICHKLLDESKRSLIGHIDHNHETGQVRGILCGNCNSALGLFKENKKFLSKAIDYLSYYEEG